MRFILFLFTLLGGCATTPDVFGSWSPMATFTTAKSALAIMNCLQDKVGPVSMVTKGNKAGIMTRDGSLFVRIYANGRVEVWRSTPFEGTIRSTVQSCI
jgi:hypothetical protein